MRARLFIVIACVPQSECLKETFAELDLTSDILEVVMSPSHPHFRLKTYGYAGNTQVGLATCMWCYVIVRMRVDKNLLIRRNILLFTV